MGYIFAKRKFDVLPIFKNNILILKSIHKTKALGSAECFFIFFIHFVDELLLCFRSVL